MLQRFTRLWLNDKQVPTLGFIVKGAAGWVDLIWTVEPYDTVGVGPTPFNNWGAHFVRHDGVCLDSGITMGNEFLKEFMRTGNDLTIFKMLEECYKSFDWDQKPHNSSFQLQLPGPSASAEV